MISKTLTGFGRWRNQRPAGLVVASDGSISLNNLWDVWGRQAGFSKIDILQAVRTHMFHEDGSGHLRFEVIEGGRGSTDKIIRVKPRRGAGGPGDRREDRREARDEQIREAGTPRRTTQEKLDLPLEDLINERGGGDRSMAGSSREPFAHREGRVQRKVKQMGLILETRHLRRPPVNRDEGEGIEPPRSRPRVKAPPVPQPIARASVPPVKAPPVPFFVRPTASEGMDVDDSANRKEEDLSDEGFEEEENLPGPPPGEHWKQYDDNGNTWWHYDGPKGQFACLGPGHEIQKV